MSSPATFGSSATSPGQGARPELVASVRRGSSVGRYVVLDLVGEGGFGQVFAAYDPELDRKVAVKLLRPRDDDGDEALFREARTLARVAHPNVVPVYDVGRWEGRTFLAMEFVDGVTLALHCDRMRTSGWRPIVTICRAAGLGLAAAHDAGVLHRDFKPANVLVGGDGRPRLGDFGLARQDDGDAPSSGHAMAGTPAYIAPEQHRGAPPSPASEVFAFAVTLWECLFGERPFSATPQRTWEDAKRSTPTPPPGSFRLPRALWRALLRGLAVDPKDRFATMREFLDRLELAQRRPRTLAVVLGLSTLAGGVWVFAMRGPSDPCVEVPDAGADEARQVEATFGALGLTPAEIEPATRALDRRAERWRAQWVESCRATRIDRRQSEYAFDLRAQCLERRRREFSGLVRWLTDGDEVRARSAATSVAGLPELTGCVDVESLSRAVALPEQPDARAEVEALHGEAATIRGELAIGEIEAADRRAKLLLARAEATGHAPSIAEVLLLAGTIHRHTGRLDEAHSLLRRAGELAESSGHDAIKAQVFLERAWAEGYLRDDPTRGEELVEYALAILERLDGAEFWQSRAFDIAGALAYRQGDFTGAEAAHRRALELVEGNPDVDAYATCDPYNNLAVAYDALERNDEAERTAHIAFECLEYNVGPSAPTTINALANLGKVAHSRGDLISAREHFEAALARMGPHDLQGSSRGLLELNLGATLDEAGDPAAAEPHYRAAIAILTRAWSPTAIEVGMAHLNLGQSLRSRGLHGPASQALGEAVGVFSSRDDAVELLAAAREELAALEP